MPALSKKQQKFFGIVRAIQKGEQVPTTPETAKAAADMKKGDVKKFASTKHKGLPEKKKVEEMYNEPNKDQQSKKQIDSKERRANAIKKQVRKTLPAPRFKVGARVECFAAEKSDKDNGFRKGTVVAHHYFEEGWELDRFAPYQIALDDYSAPVRGPRYVRGRRKPNPF